MTKEKFLEQLQEALEDEFIPQQIIADTLKEYGSMIDDALESGQSIEIFSQRMGSPKKVAKALAKEHPHRGRQSNRMVALTPFIATISFFLLGVFLNAWHPGWLVFLMIPIAGILSSSRISWPNLFTFLILIVFILGGTYFDLWTPLWSLFLLLLVLPNNRKNVERIKPFAIAYSVIVVSLYHAWVLLPLDIFITPEQRTILDFILPLIGFVPLVVYGFFKLVIQIQLDDLWKSENRLRNLINVGVVLGIVILYVTLGLSLEGFWHPGWLLFLLIPVYFIVLNAKRFPIVEVMPFIATILFVLVGEYVTIQNNTSGYVISWLFFLLIPISGILFKGGDSR